MRAPLLLALLALAVASCERQPAQPNVKVDRVWVRLPAVTGRAAAGYFTLKASGREDRLIGIDAPNARIEMHESMSAGGMSSMRPLAAVALPAGKPVTFEPGGKHAMIFGLPATLKPGGAFALTFRFAAAPPVTTQARLVGAGEDVPEHGGH